MQISPGVDGRRTNTALRRKGGKQTGNNTHTGLEVCTVYEADCFRPRHRYAHQARKALAHFTQYREMEGWGKYGEIGNLKFTCLQAPWLGAKALRGAGLDQAVGHVSERPSGGREGGAAEDKRDSSAEEMLVLRGEGPVPGPPLALLQMLRDPDLRRKVDLQCVSETEVEDLADGNSSIAHMTYKDMLWKGHHLRPSDVILLTFVVRGEKEGSFLLLSCSVEHAAVPMRTQYERIHVEMCGFQLEPMPEQPNTTLVTYISEVRNTYIMYIISCQRH